MLFSYWVMPEYLLPPWTAVCQVPLSSTVSGGCSSSCPLSHWCHLTVSYSKGEGCPLLLLASVFPSIRVFSNESRLFQWVTSFPVSQLVASCGQSIGVSSSASVLLMSDSRLISFRIDWFDLLIVQGTLRSFSSTTVRKHLALPFPLRIYCTESICLLVSK